MVFSVQTESDLKHVISAVFELQPKGLYLFYGDLGAGKTTLIKHLLQHKQVLEVVSSPTYNILHKYHTKSGETVLHADLYRLKSEQEILDLAWFDECATADSVFVEWPELLMGLIDEPYLKIELHLNLATGIRTISLSLMSV